MKRAAIEQERREPSGAPRTEFSQAASSDAGSSTDTDARHSVTINLAGKEYRLRSEASEAWMQQVAGYLDQSLQQIKERTSAVDSLDIALLTALNLAREVLYLRDQIAAGTADASQVSDLRLRSLIEQIETELPSTGAGLS